MLLDIVVSVAMCHHVDMDIDWETAVTEQEPETEPQPEAEEPELDAEETPDIAPPADD